MPISILMAVDLPAPLRPSKPYTLPCGTRRLSESTTRRPFVGCGLAGTVAPQQAIHAALRQGELKQLDPPPPAVMLRKPLCYDRIVHVNSPWSIVSCK